MRLKANGRHQSSDDIGVCKCKGAREIREVAPYAALKCSHPRKTFAETKVLGWPCAVEDEISYTIDINI
jgi:hypothetical protein